MNIVVHRTKLSDAMFLSNYLMYEFKEAGIGEYITVKHDGSVIEIGDGIHIDFRGGDVLKLAGLRPDFYLTDSAEASNFLAQSAAKCGGRELYILDDIYNLVICYLDLDEIKKEKKENEQID